MGLLVDTDAFCKLGVCDGVLDLVTAALDGSATQPQRLAALPHMLKRGRLKKRLGDDNCAKLLSMAAPLPEVKIESNELLDLMTGETDIDPGEALLFAACIEQDAQLVTADKRAIRAVNGIGDVRTELAGRLVTMEAALLAVGADTDLKTLKSVMQPAAALDTMVKVAFSPGDADPADALTSYLRSFANEVGEDLLWLPPGFAIGK